jgi:hypothetical protein
MTLDDRIDVARIERLQFLRTELYNLYSLRGVHIFGRSLAAESPVELVFAFLLDSWTLRQEVDHDTPFLPAHALSPGPSPM